jgi:hypothetical protein
MWNTTDLLIYCFPSIYFQSYVIHFLDLLLKYWGKKTWAKQILPMKLLFFMDNCVKDNKNQYFLAFLSLLTMKETFSKVWIFVQKVRGIKKLYLGGLDESFHGFPRLTFIL